MICAQDGRHNKCNILYDNDLAHCGAPSGRRPFNTWTPSDRPFGALAGGYLNVAPLGAISRRRRSGPVLYIVAAAQDNLLSNVVRSRTLQNGLPFQVARHKCIPLELAQLGFATAPTGQGAWREIGRSVFATPLQVAICAKNTVQMRSGMNLSISMRTPPFSRDSMPARTTRFRRMVSFRGTGRVLFSTMSANAIIMLAMLWK